MTTDIDSAVEMSSVPPPLSSGQPHSRSQREGNEKNKNMKRPFDQLDEGFSSETQRLPQRSVQIRENGHQLPGDISGLEKEAHLNPNLATGLELLAASTNETVRNDAYEGAVQDTEMGDDRVADSHNHQNGSPRTVRQSTADHDTRANELDSTGDVEMQNGIADEQQSPRRRVTRQSSTAMSKSTSSPKSGIDSTPSKSNSKSKPTSSVSLNLESETNGQRASSTSSTLAHALGRAPIMPVPNGEVSVSSSSKSPPTNVVPPSPSMESILKVAEAAVAAQNAAKQAKLAVEPSGQADATTDPNLDPSLFSSAKNVGEGSEASGSSSTVAKPNPPPVDTTTSTSNSTASGSNATPTSSITPSSLSNNPYLSLSANLLSRAGSGSTTPTGHHIFMPYPLFYPPATPVAPGSPSYSIPYNPYYYLTAPMPGPNGMYPAPANFTPQPTVPQQRPPPAEPPRAKPKRLKAHTVTTKSFSIPMVPRDKKGKPMLPLNVGIMTVINLGEVCMREHFHTERYIFPVGYEVTRRYLSTVDPTIEVVYHCTILDGGDGPKFQIIPSDRLDKPIIAGTATGAWSSIVKQANAIRNRQHSNSVSGPDFFGLGQNTIKHLIQELPNADRLRDYVWQNFVEGGPLGGRHAAVIPALPEEYDASLPIGAYYPKREANPNPNLPRGMSHYPQHIIAQAEAQRLQKLAQQQQQLQQQQSSSKAGQQAVAGPSTSITSSSSIPPGQAASDVLPGGATSDSLNIQQYQHTQTLEQVPLQGQQTPTTPEKRTIREVPAIDDTSSSSATRQTRARANQQQVVTPTVHGTDPTTLNADGTTPTTFASIMSAYPAPGQPTTTS